MKSWLTCLIALSFFACAPAAAQESNGPAMQAVPATGGGAQEPGPETESPSLPETKSGPVVIEIFTSQACVFCPTADRFFADIIRAPEAIGLACHVDYFDVKEGSLAREFCSERQSEYMTLLRAGPNYTPQVIVNGAVEAIGYRHEEVSAALRAATAFPVLPLIVQKGSQKNELLVTFPSSLAAPVADPEKGLPQTEFTLWLARYDKARDVTIAEGSNRGKQMTYVNIVSELEPLEPWDGVEKYRTFTADLKARHKGLAILAQDPKTGRIVAAGKYEVRKKK